MPPSTSSHATSSQAIHRVQRSAVAARHSRESENIACGNENVSGRRRRDIDEQQRAAQRTEITGAGQQPARRQKTRTRHAGAGAIAWPPARAKNTTNGRTVEICGTSPRATSARSRGAMASARATPRIGNPYVAYCNDVEQHYRLQAVAAGVFAVEEKRQLQCAAKAQRQGLQQARTGSFQHGAQREQGQQRDGTGAAEWRQEQQGQAEPGGPAGARGSSASRIACAQCQVELAM